MEKYIKIRPLGYDENKDIFTNQEDEIIIQEKLDGANFRFTILNGKIIFGSRTQQLTSDEGEDTNIQKNFLRAVNFVRDTIKDKFDSDLEDLEGFVFYGECMVKHTLNYDWENIPPFLGFDILATYDEKNEWCSYEDCLTFFNRMGLEMVPLFKRTTVKDILFNIKTIDDELVPISKYSLNKAEGLVFKNYKKQIFAKYVRTEFKEKNKDVFGGGKKLATTDDEYLTAVYCTNARIDKIIFKLIDEGNLLEMSLMQYLPKRVWMDIWEEEMKEIINIRGRACNFQRFRKLVTNRCLSVLKQVITNNSLQ